MQHKQHNSYLQQYVKVTCYWERKKIKNKQTKHDHVSPLVRIVKEIHIPLYLKAYISATLGRDKILDP